jgi:glycine cleavage system H protein
MPAYLETIVDKFIFRIATDRLYSSEGLWAKAEDDKVRIGMTDFLQQRSGDVAFVEIIPAGTTVAVGDELIVIETIKVDISLSSPVSGTVIEINPAMQDSPEIINQDPYGEGWIVGIEASNLERDNDQLMDPESYFTMIKGQAEEEVNKL